MGSAFKLCVEHLLGCSGGPSCPFSFVVWPTLDEVEDFVDEVEDCEWVEVLMDGVEDFVDGVENFDGWSGGGCGLF